MSISFSTKKIVSSYLLISILFFGYNMLQLPKLPYFALRFLLMFIVAVYALKIIKHNIKRSPGMSLFLCYFLYLIFSFLLFFAYDFPSTLIPDAVMSGLFPMLFFFVGSADKEESVFEVRFYKYYLWGCIFLFVCSIYLFVTLPSWYLEWKISVQPDEWQDNIKVLGSMSGFSGSGYLVGYTALFSFCYLLFKFKSKVAKKYDILFLFIVVFCLIFSQARVAVLTAAIILLWYLKAIINPKNFFKLLLIAVVIILFLYYIISSSESLSALFEIFFSKVKGASEDTRYETGLTLLSQQTNFIFGHGYGSGGHKANTLGLPSVTDFEYIKLLYETGIVGLTLFFVILYKTFGVIKNNKHKYTFEFFIIVFYLMAMLIANPLTADATMSPVYWYAMGRVLS